MPEKTRAGAIHTEAKTDKKTVENPPSEVRPHPADQQARLLSQQRAVGNKAVQKLIKSGSLHKKRTASPRDLADDVEAESVQIQASPSLQQKDQKSQESATAISENEEIKGAENKATKAAISNSGASSIQRAWYNFDIPFTDYQFDPSIKGVKTAAGVVKEKAVEAVEWILDEIKALINAGVEWLSEKWTSIQELAWSGFEAIKDSFFKIIGFIKSPLSFVANAVMNFDADSLAKGWASFTGIVSSLTKGFQTTVGNLVQQVSGVWGKISGYADWLLGKVTGLTQNFVFKRLPDALQKVAYSLIARVQSLWKRIQDGWKSIFGAIKAWIDSALEAILGFVRRVLSFGILAVIEGIRQFGKLVLFIKDLLTNPQKYVEILAKKGMQSLEGLESRFSGIVSQYFGTSQKAAPATARAATTAPATARAETIQRQQAAPGAVSEKKRSARWSEIGSGILEMMGKKWIEFKSNPWAILSGLLMDMILPIVGNVKDVIQLFKDIKKIVTGPFSAGSLEELWTSILQILDIPILIYHTVVSILMRSLMLPLIVASFIPHPVVKGIAAAVGLGLLGAFVNIEIANVGHKLLLLKTGATTKDQKQEAYNRVADSFIALAMAAVIFLVILFLNFMANVVKGIYNFVKAKVFPAKTAPVKTKGGIPESSETKATEEGRAGEKKGSKSEVVEFEQASLDGKRKVQITEEGICKVCASPCDRLRSKYSKELAKRPDLSKRISDIEGAIDSKSNKLKQYREVEQELAEFKRINRINEEPQRLRDEYAEELKDPANKSLEDRLKAAEDIADPALKQQELAEIQRELTARRHPAKQGAYHGKKPPYTNPGHHDPSSPNFRGRGSTTTPLPKDAAKVYEKAVPDKDGRNWYGRGADGDVYRYAPNGGNDPGVHWNGRENSPRGLEVPPEVRDRL